MLQKLATILYLSGEHTPIARIATLLNVSKEEVETGLIQLESTLNSIGLQLLRIDNGVSIVTSKDQADLVELFWKEELKGDLTPAALQVLTLVCYLRDGTREQISYIRGVQSTQSIRMLTVRGLITRKEEVCTVTAEALKHLGILRVEDLPDYESIHAQLKEKLENRSS